MFVSHCLCLFLHVRTPLASNFWQYSTDFIHVYSLCNVYLGIMMSYMNICSITFKHLCALLPVKVPP